MKKANAKAEKTFDSFGHISPSARERALRSSDRLLTLHAPLLRTWGTQRGASWGLTSNSSVAQIIQKLGKLRNLQDLWEPLKTSDRAVSTFDLVMMREIRSNTQDAIARWNQQEEINIRASGTTETRPDFELSTDEVLKLMRAFLPTITREQVQSLLFDASRKRRIARARQGVYVPYAKRPFRSWRDEYNRSPEEEAWEKRYEEKCEVEVNALVVHVLFPKLASYRKAKAINQSERNYYYLVVAALSRAMESYLWEFDRIANVQR